MALTEFETALAEVKLDEFMARIRPSEELLADLDIAYKIEDQSIIIEEVRSFRGRETRRPVAKATYVKKTGAWKIYWMRQDAKWHSYEPRPDVATLQEAFAEWEKDPHGCFWG